MKKSELRLPTLEVSPLDFHIKLQKDVTKYEIPLKSGGLLTIEAKAGKLTGLFAIDRKGNKVSIDVSATQAQLLKKSSGPSKANDCKEIKLTEWDPDGPRPDSTKTYKGIVCSDD